MLVVDVVLILVLLSRTEPLFDAEMIHQFRYNVYAYCELLFRWQMYNKRLELLKAVTVNQSNSFLSDNKKAEVHRIGPYSLYSYQPTIFLSDWVNCHIGLDRICVRGDCKTVLPEKARTCPQCNTFCSLPTCTICRLPVKGMPSTTLLLGHHS